MQGRRTLHCQAGIFTIGTKRNAKTNGIHQANRVRNDFENVHGETNAFGTAGMHDLVNLGELDDAAKHHNAEAQAFG